MGCDGMWGLWSYVVYFMVNSVMTPRMTVRGGEGSELKRAKGSKEWFNKSLREMEAGAKSALRRKFSWEEEWRSFSSVNCERKKNEKVAWSSVPLIVPE